MHYNPPVKTRLIFFGSFQNYSVQILERLCRDFQVTAVITTPPAPKGRHLHLVKNEAQIYSEKHNLPCFTLDTLDNIPSDISRNPPDFIVVSGYGKLIPKIWLNHPQIMSVNMHQSLLPHYAGRCPAEWAILNGETQTGVTLIQMTEKFDSGPILAQKSLPIDPEDTRETLYRKLYAMGAEMLVSALPQIASGQIQAYSQPGGDNFYARQITRQDGFVPWEEFQHQLKTNDRQLATKLRALAGWPGVWTTDPAGKRLKLVSLSPPLVQSEGKTPIPWRQL